MAELSLLVVDGDHSSRQVLELSLRKAGFVIHTARDVDTALRMLHEQLPSLIISETSCGDVDGFELLRLVKSDPQLAHTPFIFLTANEAPNDRARGLEAGCDDYLIKPIFFQEVVRRVKAVLGKQQLTDKGTHKPFTGQLAEVSVVDLVQLMEFGRRSGTVHIVSAAGETGKMYFDDGQLIDAETEYRATEAAFFRLLTWSNGSFRVEFQQVERPRKIQQSCSELMGLGLERLDGWEGLTRQLPPMRVVCIVNEQRTAQQAALSKASASMLALFDGERSLLDILNASTGDDHEILRSIAELIETGIVVEPGPTVLDDQAAASAFGSCEALPDVTPPPKAVPDSWSRDFTTKQPFSFAGLPVESPEIATDPDVNPPSTHDVTEHADASPSAEQADLFRSGSNTHHARASVTIAESGTLALFPASGGSEHDAEDLQRRGRTPGRTRRPTQSLRSTGRPSNDQADPRLARIFDQDVTSDVSVSSVLIRRIRRRIWPFVLTAGGSMLAGCILAYLILSMGLTERSAARPESPTDNRPAGTAAKKPAPPATQASSRPVEDTAIEGSTLSYAKRNGDPATPSKQDTASCLHPPCSKGSAVRGASSEKANAKLAPSDISEGTRPPLSGDGIVLIKARLLLAAGRRTAAYNLLHEAVTRSPHAWTAIERLALLELSAGRDDSALRLARQALASNPQAPYAHLVAGSVFQNAGDREHARKYYEHFLKTCGKCSFANEVRSILERL